MIGVFPQEEVELACSTLAPTGQLIATELHGSSGPDTVGQTLVWRRYFEPSTFWTCHPSYLFGQKIYITLVLTPDTVVRFSRLDSNAVYPYYPAIRNDTVTVGVKKRFMDLEAKIAYGDSILRNYPITIKQPVLVDSGGHSHGGTRPLGTYNYPIGSSNTTLTTFTAMTDTAGKLKFRYLASQFGGIERIKAHTVSDTTKFDTLSLITKVPGLQLLSEGSHYVKVGGTCLHHGPRDDTSYPNCRTPDTDHWGTNTLVQAIQAIADAYDSLHVGIRLRINDMSLFYGGGFDLGGNWEDDIVDKFPASPDTCNLVGHCTHRQGITGDISHQGLNQSGGYVSIVLKDIRKIIRRATRIDSHKEGDHEHVKVRR